VIVDGLEVDRWAGGAGFNETTLRTFINIDLSPKIEATLGLAINDSDDITTITFASSAASLTALNKLKNVANKLVLIDDERFTFTGISLADRQLTGVTRAQRFSAKAAHTTSDTVRWIEHDIYVVYKNDTATAPIVDDNRKPVIALASSTNTSWVWTDYYDKLYPSRAGSWYGALTRSTGLNYGGTSGTYTATENTDVTSGEADVMGMRIASFSVRNLPRTEQATLAWSFTCPFGAMTHVTTSGKVYRYLTSWPAFKLQKLVNGLWTDVWSEATPDAAATWEDLSAGVQGVDTALSGYLSNIRYLFDGAVAGVASNLSCAEADSITITKSSTYTPGFSITAESSQYNIDAVISNQTTGQALTIVGTMKIDDSLVIDCENQTITLNDDTNCLSWMTARTPASSSDIPRREWMRLNVGNNTIRYAESGIARVDMTVTYNERSL